MNRLSIKEASHRLGVAEPTVRRRIRRGELEHGKGDDGRIWVCVPELVAVEPLFEEVDGQLEPVAEEGPLSQREPFFNETPRFEQEPLSDEILPAEEEPSANEGPGFDDDAVVEEDTMADPEPRGDAKNVADAPAAAEGRAPSVDERLIAEAFEAKDQMIAELTAERDRWVAEAASKQALIEVLVEQGENYQVLLHEAQAAVKRLSTPPAEPRRPVQEIELQRVSSRHEPDDDEGDDENDAPQQRSAAPPPAAASAPPRTPDVTEPEPPPPTTAVVPQRKWWWR